MMRRRSSLQSYDIDDDQTLHDYPDDVDIGPDAKRATPSCIAINNANGSNGRIQSPKSPQNEDAAEGVFSSYVPWSSGTNSPVTTETNDEALAVYDPTSITVHMSILQELGTGQSHDEAYHSRGQGWMDNAVLWRRCPYLDDSPMVIGSPSASYPSVAEEELELASAAADPDDERQHEERRTVERFASYKTRSNAIGTTESGSGTPKSRRRNKRKGCDSPRPPPDDPTPQTVTADSPGTSDSTETGQGCEQPATTNGEQFANFDDLAYCLVGTGRFASEVADESGDGSEPITSHGMRPGRGWADEEDDDEVTVSPRVMSPELDEPAGSLHVRAFHKRCNEPQERRTTFIALGNLNNLRSSSPMMVPESDENPTTQRARQLVLLIQSLKDKVKLYEDAFEQRYGYRPSHHQKMDDRNTKRVLTELARSRKELKQLKERYRLSDPLDVEVAESRDPAGVTTSATFLTEKLASSTATVEETVLEVQEHLAGNRQLAGRSEVVEELSPKEVLDEKLAVQRALLYVESLHGRPASYKHKDLLRPLYDRYRILKRVVVRSGLSRSKEEVCDLAPILEYEPLELSETRVIQRHSAPPTPSLELMDMSVDQPCSPRPSARRHTAPATTTDRIGSTSSSWCGDTPVLTWKRQKISLNIEENLHALPLNQLVEQMRHVREEKRRLRRAIRDMEADVLRQQSAKSIRYSAGSNGAKTDSDETGDPLEPVYAQYRHARAKLRLLEALVAKHDGTATL